MSFRRSELKAFLRSRRALIQPEALGLPRGGRRLISGLRREEVAQAAGVGLTWYTWLEQGRDITPSSETLGRIARALRLSAADEIHLFLLADVARNVRSVLPGKVPLAVEHVLAAFRGPAVILDSMFGLVTSNDLASRLYRFERSVDGYPENQLWQFFMNPERRALYPDYDAVASGFVALFRSSTVDFEEPHYRRLIEDLMIASPSFAALWTTQETTSIAAQTVRLSHPDFGQIETYSVRTILPSMGNSLLFLVGPADEITKRAFDQFS